jgi:molybdopterin converting factor subunit 1
VRLTVLCFARLRDLAGVHEWTCDVRDGATVRDVWRALVDAKPAVDAMSGAVSSAVNAEFATMNTPVRAGDEVAFLPPVSGGAGTHS